MDAAPPGNSCHPILAEPIKSNAGKRAQIFLKCALCLLIMAPPILGQVPVTVQQRAHRYGTSR